MEKTSSILDNGWLILIAIATMGLAPFFPEPHIWGKIKWIVGGGVGMNISDYFDTAMHGLPWVLGIVFLVRKFIIKP